MEPRKPWHFVRHSPADHDWDLSTAPDFRALQSLNSNREKSNHSTAPVDGPIDRLRDAFGYVSVNRSSITFSDARALAEARASETGVLRDLSALRFRELWVRFERYAERSRGVTHVADVNRDLVEAWIDSKLAGGAEPATNTKHLRRAAIRYLFKLLRSYSIVDFDPTLDITLPARGKDSIRPLDAGEIMTCRAASLSTLHETRRPAVLALAEAGLWTSELADLRSSSVTPSCVLAPGNAHRDSRTVVLSAWGRIQVARHARTLPDEAEVLFVAGPTRTLEDQRETVRNALRRILRDTGLIDEPHIKPRSITLAAGLEALRREGSIEQAALTLGIRSLDLTADLLGYRWRPC